MRLPKAVVCGVAGTQLASSERLLFEQNPPTGFILFKRNCETPGQVKSLTSELKALFPDRWVPILIDQEGGRVQRLRGTDWPDWPPAADIGKLAQSDLSSGLAAARLHARLIARQLTDIGVDVNCAPVLDLGLADTTEAIGSRAFSAEPEIVAKLGRAAIAGFTQGGVVPVIKHLPGHGRARVDSHLELPVIDVALEVWRKSDAIPLVANAAAPMAMTCHLLFEALDNTHPATCSKRIINDIIRGEIGFSGILLSDDLSMKALKGPIQTRAAASLAAGCDLALHCNGDLSEMRSVLEAVPNIKEARFAALQALRPGPPEQLDASLGNLMDMLSYG